MTLDGKRILVTGASRGLGRALVACFAAAGARCAFTWTRDEAGARATLAAAGGDEGRCRAFRVSVLDAAASRTMVRELEAAWGGIDALVNNAGINQNLPVALMEEKDWDQVLGVNLKGAFLTAKAVLPGMLKRKAGVILNMGSMAGERLIDAPVHYCASKAALRGFTQALAREVGRHGIRVNCLAPGLLDDGVGATLPPHRLKDYLKHCALGRVGKVDEVAALAALLIGDATFVNGETIVMDGGL